MRIDMLNSHVIRFFLPRHKKMAKNYNNEVLFTRNDKRPWLCSWRALQREWGLASVDDVPRALLTTPDWYLISKIGNRYAPANARWMRDLNKDLAILALGEEEGSRVGNHSYRAGSAQEALHINQMRTLFEIEGGTQRTYSILHPTYPDSDQMACVCASAYVTGYARVRDTQL